MPRTRKGSANESAIAFLKAYRQARELTQADFAERAEVRQQQVSKYETGKNKIPLELVRTIEALWGESFASFQRTLLLADDAVRPGFAAGKQATYAAGAPLLAADDSGALRREVMVLDLKLIEDLSDRQRIRDLYEAVLRKRKSA